jgi:prepilin-type N-terminal cleavage/methylation domain-containing protein
MSQQNINSKKSRGFTIVELLVVVVVIGILAAITIVSYTGITARANTAAGVSAMNAVVSKSTVYGTDGPTGSLPASFGSLTGAAATTTYYLASSAPTGVDFTTASGNVRMSTYRPSGIQNDAIDYIVCGANGTTSAPTTYAGISVVSGAIIGYWDYSLGTPAENVTNTIGYTTGNYPTTTSNPVACFKVGLAESAIAVAKAMYAETGNYPVTATGGATSFMGSTAIGAKIPSILSVGIANPTSANGTTTVKFECTTAVAATLPCLAGAAGGGRITYWDYSAGAVATAVYGATTAYTTPAS